MDANRVMKVSLRARARLLMYEDEPLFFRESLSYVSPSASSFLAERSHLGHDVVSFLSQLEKKLDFLVAALQEKKIEDFYPIQASVTSLGVEELSFACKEALAPNDKLECILFLSEFPTEFLALCLRVVGIAEQNESVKIQGTKYTLAFCDLGDEEKEKLIQFIFKEERRILRKQKKMDELDI